MEGRVLMSGGEGTDDILCISSIGLFLDSSNFRNSICNGSST